MGHMKEWNKFILNHPIQLLYPLEIKEYPATFECPMPTDSADIESRTVAEQCLKRMTEYSIVTSCAKTTGCVFRTLCNCHMLTLECSKIFQSIV